MPKGYIDIQQTVFPVASMRPGKKELTRGDFWGTAFAIRNDLFLTAAHVVQNAIAEGELWLGGPTTEGTPMGFAPIAEHELFLDLDIALLRSDRPLAVTVLNEWLASRVQLLQDLSTFGYPHATTIELEEERIDVVFRGYKGHIVTTKGFRRLPGSPAVYELSCPFPIGLSGAPVLWPKDDHLLVAGVVIGTDNISYSGVAQTPGIAVVADEIARVHSSLLGGVLGDKAPLVAVGIEVTIP
jgi:hypothetical protein